MVACERDTSIARVKVITTSCCTVLGPTLHSPLSNPNLIIPNHIYLSSGDWVVGKPCSASRLAVPQSGQYNPRVSCTLWIVSGFERRQTANERTKQEFFLPFLFSGGWVKINLKLPHFRVSDTMSCFDLTHAPVATAARAAATGLVSMSTRPDPEGSGTVVEIATRR